MTVAQLEDAVARLGFAPSLDDGGELLRDAAERAIGQILAVRPRLGTVTLHHLPRTPLFAIGTGEEIGSEKTFSLPEGGSFYLKTVGEGVLYVSRGEVTKEHRLTGGEGGLPTVTVGGIPTAVGGVTLRLLGLEGLRLVTLAVFPARFRADAPPRSPFETSDYELSALIPDFAGLAAPPRLGSGEALREGVDGDYTLEGTLLRLLPRAACELRLSYRRRIVMPSEGEIPLAAEEAALLPLFCAAYVFLDEDPDKASFYLARFREGLSAILPEREAVSAFRDVNGWG